MPPLTPEAQQRNQAAQAARKIIGARSVGSHTDRSSTTAASRAASPGSFLPVIYNNGNEIVQGPGWVALRNEMIHETRIVPLDSRPRLGVGDHVLDGRLARTLGRQHARRRDTNFNSQHCRASASTVVAIVTRREMKVTERITRVSPDAAGRRKMTFDDPKTWTRPFTIELPLKRDDSYGMFEYACHEGNYSMFNILSGARADEKAAK